MGSAQSAMHCGAASWNTTAPGDKGRQRVRGPHSHHGLQPRLESLDRLLASVVGQADKIVRAARQLHVECLDERAVFQLWGDERVTADTDAFAGNHRLNSVQFLPETQVSHFIEFGYVAPFRTRDLQPSLPRR